MSDVNLLPQITPLMRMAGGSNEVSTPHGSAQRFNNYTTGVEILPKVDVKQQFLKGDDIRQSAIIRTDGKLNGVCFSFYTNEDGHRFQPCVIRNLGNKNYLITCKWRADKDVNIRCIDIVKMDITGHTYIEIDKPFIGISQVGGVVPTNCLTGFYSKNTGIANFNELGLVHITASGNHSYLDPVQYNFNVQPNKRYHLKFLAWGSGQFRTFMYPGAVLSENGSSGDGMKTWYLQSWTPTWYEADFASLPTFYGDAAKKLLFRSDVNQTTDLWLDLNSVIVTELGGVNKTLVLPNILKKPTTFNPNINGVQWPAEWSKGQWRSASGGLGKRYGIAIKAEDSPIGKALTAFHIESTSISTGTVDVAQDSIPIHHSTWTLSVWARGKGKAGLHVADKRADGSWFYPVKVFDLTSEWKRYEFTTPITGTDITSAYIGLNQDGAWGEFAAPKFEEGASATAFVDELGGVTNLLHDSVPTKLYPDRVNPSDDLHWFTTSGGPGKPSIVELGSDIDVRYGFQILDNARQTNRDFALHGQFIKPNSGKYTFSVWTKLLSKNYVDGKGIFRVWDSNSKNPWGVTGQRSVFDKWTLETFTFDTTGWTDANWFSIQMGITGGGSIRLAKPMLVKGEIAENWAPRPEEEPIAWK